MDGFSEIRSATAPAPWVYSPVEFKLYLDKSEHTTIAFLPVLLEIQSTLFCRASTPPMQAKVISVISQFFRQRFPKSFSRYCSTRSVA